VKRLHASDLVGPDPKTLQGVGPEGCGDGHVGGVAATGDEYATDALGIVARIERVPCPTPVGLESAGKVHVGIGRRQANVTRVSRAVARGNIQAAAERDSRV